MAAFHGALQEYLEERGLDPKDLPKVDVRERPLLEILPRAGGPLRLRLKGSEALANLLASRRRLYEILGAVSEREAYEKLVRSTNIEPYVTEMDFGAFFKETDVKPADLAATFLRGTPPYITSSVVAACLDGVCNASIHRIMVGPGYYAVRVVPRHLHRMLTASGGALPVAIVVGVHPAVMLAAAHSPPYGVYEIPLASTISGRRLAVCRTPKYSIPVPCGASYVFEGRLGPARAREGPFPDVLGLLDRVRDEPVLSVDGAYVNKVFAPLSYVIVPGSCEHLLLMGFPREASVYHSVSRVAHVVKVRLTPASGMWLHAVISISKTVEGEAVNAGLAALASHPSLKAVIIVDEDVDPDDPYQVEWAVATRVRWGRDVVVVRGARGSSLDPSSEDGLVDKVIIDATRPADAPAERFARVTPLPGMGVSPPCT